MTVLSLHPLPFLGLRIIKVEQDHPVQPIHSALPLNHSARCLLNISWRLHHLPESCPPEGWLPALAITYSLTGAPPHQQHSSHPNCWHQSHLCWWPSCLCRLSTTQHKKLIKKYKDGCGKLPIPTENKKIARQIPSVCGGAGGEG